MNKGLVFLDHHHALSWLVDDRCTFRCVTQCVAFIVAFSGSLAQQRFALLLTLRRIIFLHQDESDIFLNARLTRFLIVSLVTILVWDLNRNRNIFINNFTLFRYYTFYLFELFSVDIILRHFNDNQILDCFTIVDRVENSTSEVTIDAHRRVLDQQVFQR